MHFRIVYPKENPDDAEKDITNMLAHIGVFDGLRQDKNNNEMTFEEAVDAVENSIGN